MNNKVFVLTDGDYSDYHIIGCFSNLELANKAKDQYGGEIEVYDLDFLGRDNRFPFYVQLYVNTGNVRLANIGKNLPEKRIGTLSLFNSNELMFFSYVLAENKEHAIKIVSEQMREYKIANNL